MEKLETLEERKKIEFNSFAIAGFIISLLPFGIFVLWIIVVIASAIFGILDYFTGNSSHVKYVEYDIWLFILYAVNIIGTILCIIGIVKRRKEGLPIGLAIAGLVISAVVLVILLKTH